MATNDERKIATHKHLWFSLFSVLVSGGVLIYLLFHVSIYEVGQVLRRISYRGVIVFLVFSFSMSLCRTWRYTLLLRLTGHIPDKIALFLITLIRNLFSDLLPARLGTLIYIYLIKRRLGIPIGPATSSFAISFIFDIFVLAVLIIPAAFAFSATQVSSTIIIGMATILAISSITVFFFLPDLLSISGLLALRLPIINTDSRHRLEKAMESAKQGVLLTRNKRVYGKIFFLSLGVRIFKYLSLYILLLALVLPMGYDFSAFPVYTVFLGLCSAEFAASLPISGIAGFGAYEGTWSLVFQLLGYSKKVAVLTSISHHLLTQVYSYLLGALALFILLLPLFKYHSKKQSFFGKTKERFFWLRFAMVIIIPLAVSLVIFPLSGNSQLKDQLYSTKQELIADHQKLPVSSLGGIKGWVVYERPDGIYKIQLGSNTPLHLVDSGTYPKWSPDGKMIAFVREQAIMVMTADGKYVRKVAEAKRPRAVVFHSDGNGVLFTDGKLVRLVRLDSGVVKTIVQEYEFKELDIDEDGKKLVVTIKVLAGYHVLAYDLDSGKVRKVSRGCSASLSPNGQYITVNGQNHKFLHLYDWDSLQIVDRVNASPNHKFDNQFWANHPDWLISTSENGNSDIYIHHIWKNKALQITKSGNCDFADLFIFK